jgi:hypothetical protein
MSEHHPELLRDIRAFLAKTGMGPAYFGKRAAENSELVKRLENNGRVWPETERRIRDFMAAHEASV